MLLISGKRGSGKTKLMVKFLIEKMLNGINDTFYAHEEIQNLNSLGYHFKEDFKHLAFANLDVNTNGTRIPFMRINAFNPFRFGFKCEDGYKTYLVPPGSLIGIDEAQRVFNSHMAGYLRAEVSGAIETSRQWGADFILCTQRPMLIAPNVRELVDEFIHCLRVEDMKDSRGFYIGHRWHVLIFTEWANLKTYLESGKKNSCEEKIITHNRCLHQNYDSYFCRYMFLKGREEDDFYIKNFPNVNSIDDVESFGDDFGLNVPKGYWKTKADCAGQADNTEVYF